MLAEERRKVFRPSQGGLMGLILLLYHWFVRITSKQTNKMTCSCSNDAGAELSFPPAFSWTEGFPSIINKLITLSDQWNEKRIGSNLEAKLLLVIPSHLLKHYLAKLPIALLVCNSRAAQYWLACRPPSWKTDDKHSTRLANTTVNRKAIFSHFHGCSTCYIVL